MSAAYAKALDIERLIAFDMGGTTAKCTLIEQGRFDVQSTYYVGGYDYGLPIRTPVLDIVEVGTGGGSIAHLAGDGALTVGPRSAGSDPGPVCFQRGGVEPTVTDANAILDRISDGNFLDGKITLDRGRDARNYELFAFGGGGPLHAVELARQLHIPRVIVPPEPGNFSAIGMLFASARLDESRSIRGPVDAGLVSELHREVAKIHERMTRDLRHHATVSDIVFETGCDVRFSGQRNWLKVPLPRADGDALHLRKRYFDMYRNRYGGYGLYLIFFMIPD